MPQKIEFRKKEKKDVAKATILVLLILTILLSVISTWYILDTINSVKQQYGSLPSVAYAKINVGIIPPGNESEEPVVNAPITGKAVVGLSIIEQ